MLSLSILPVDDLHVDNLHTLPLQIAFILSFYFSVLACIFCSIMLQQQRRIRLPWAIWNYHRAKTKGFFVLLLWHVQDFTSWSSNKF